MTLKTFATFVFKFFSQKRKEVKDGFVFKMRSSKEIECSAPIVVESLWQATTNFYAL